MSEQEFRNRLDEVLVKALEKFREENEKFRSFYDVDHFESVVEGFCDLVKTTAEGGKRWNGEQRCLLCTTPPSLHSTQEVQDDTE